MCWYAYISTTHKFTEKFICYIFMYIRIQKYDADNVLDDRTDEHLVTYSMVKMIVLTYIFVSPWRRPSLQLSR